MFRLAHLSDPHLGPLPDPLARELMGKRVLGYLNWRLNRRGALRPKTLDDLVADVHAHKPDHIAVTGDIVNIALDAELEPARQWLASLGPGPKVSVVPGNHDAYVKGALKRASQSWGPHMWGDGAGHVQFPFVRRRGEIAIIGVSSAKHTGPFMATGHMERGQDLLLARALEHAGHEGLFRVVMIHHPPIKGAAPWAGRLVNSDRFRAAVREAGAELVLHGHTHERSVGWIAGAGGKPVPVVGVPSASASPGGNGHGAGWNLFEIDRPGNDWVIRLTERGFVVRGKPIGEVASRVLEPPPGFDLSAGLRRSRRRTPA